MSADSLRAVSLYSEEWNLDLFDSGVATVDRWLRNSAKIAAATGTAATYVLVRGRRVVGYYALAMNAVDHSHAPPRLRRGVPNPVPVVLLAKLAIDRAEQGHGLGGHLLADALRRCVRGGTEFGARAVVVDAIDERAADFYRHFGFRDLDERRLWRRLNDIASILEVTPD